MNACIRNVGRVLVSAALGALVSLFLIAAFARAQSPTMFKGELADEQLNCIQTPVKAPMDIKDKTSCMLYFAHFVKPGSKYVLYDTTTKQSTSWMTKIWFSLTWAQKTWRLPELWKRSPRPLK